MPFQKGNSGRPEGTLNRKTKTVVSTSGIHC